MNLVTHLPDGISVIALQRRNGDVFPCLIDTIDWDLVKEHTWGIRFNGRHSYYVRTKIPKTGSNRKDVAMHQMLTSTKFADHKDGCGWDNRRKNLRTATQAQNTRNNKKHLNMGFTSRFKGVSWAKNERKWNANIFINRKHKNLGYFVVEEDAAKAYNKAAKQFFGRFANLNEIIDVS